MLARAAPACAGRQVMTTAGQPHEHWGSRAGFVLAMLGSAIGLGNIWRFPYLAGSTGGGAFLVAYLVTLGLVCVPLLVAETAIGQTAQRGPLAAFALIRPRVSSRLLGWLSVLAAFVGLTYYAVLTGWVLKYLTLFIGSAFGSRLAAGDHWSDAFARFVAQPVEPVAWQLAAMAIAAAFVALGVRRGIESLSRIAMPLLLLLLVTLAAYSLTLPGAAAGLSFLFRPDWAQLGEPRVWLAALGQGLYSVGLASGTVIAFGSYLRAGQPIAAASLKVVAGDTAVSLLAGIVVFPAVFTLAIAPTEGPTLAFVTLPELFERIPAGALVGVAFFSLLAVAATTSAVAILEVPVAALMQARGVPRRWATLLVAAVAFAAGLPSALGYGLLAGLRVPLGTRSGGLPPLDAVDALLSNLLLPANGVLIAIFVGWLWPARGAMAASGLGDGVLGRVWLAAMRWVVPILIALVLAGSFRALWRSG